MLFSQAMRFAPRNILIIDFGQLGDVVLSLPALRALREKFSEARITVMVGKPCAPIANLSTYVDATIMVDRVMLRDGPKLRSLAHIARLIKDIRRRGFDLVIDLHSLSETNLLGYLSGAPARLYARRPGRSLDFLSNFRPRPAVEDSDKHAVERYLDVLAPLGIKHASRAPQLKTRPEDDGVIDRILTGENVRVGEPLIGFYIGAGHPSRRWPLARFSELAERLQRDDGGRIIIFAGPEETALLKETGAVFPSSTIVFDRLDIYQLASALARLTVLVSNNTGPMHIAAAVGTPVVTLLGRLTPDSFTPLVPHHRLLYSRTLAELSTETVYGAVRELVAELALSQPPVGG